DVIGTGGKVITEIINQTNNVKIDIEQDGRVTIMHTDKVWINKAREMVENIVRVPEVGQMFAGKVSRIEKFGAFVELWPGVEGLLHTSKMSNEKVGKVEDIMQLGDEILVKVIGIDDKGRVDLAANGYDETAKKQNQEKKKEFRNNNSRREYRPNHSRTN